VGGGADVTLTRHVSLRALQVDYLLHSFRWRFTEQLQVAERYRVAHRPGSSRHSGEWIENGGLRPAVFFQRSAVATLGLECRTRILGASLEIPFVDIEQGRLQNPSSEMVIPTTTFANRSSVPRFRPSVLSGLSPRPGAYESFLAVRQLEKFDGNIPSFPRPRVLFTLNIFA